MQSAIMLTTTRDDMRDCAMGTLVLAIGMGPIGRLQIGSLTEAYGAPLALGGHTSIAVISIIVVTAALPGFRSRIATKKEKGILAQDQNSE